MATTLALVCLVTVAALFDLRLRRIPNWLAVMGLAAGFALNWWALGVAGLGRALGGMALGLAVYMIFYLLRAMGAGDVKLMAAVGACAGAELWLRIFLATAVVGGVIALAMVVVRGRFRETMSNVGFVLVELGHLRAPHLRRTELDVRSGKGMRLPHAVAIAAGTAVALAFLRP